MKINNSVRGFLATLSLISVPAQAELLQLQMEGAWNVQYEYLGSGANFVQMSVPVAFTATITFDPSAAAAWYSDLPNHYVTEFGAPTITSSVLDYALKNPYSISVPSAFTLLSRHDYSVDPLPSAPFENYQFVNRDYVSQYLADKTQNWSFGYEFHSTNSDISLDDIKLVTGDTFTEILRDAASEGRLFGASFWSYTFETGIPYAAPATYTGGIGLGGYARIASVSFVAPMNQIPEPSTNVLLAMCLGVLVFFRKMQRNR